MSVLVSPLTSEKVHSNIIQDCPGWMIRSIPGWWSPCLFADVARNHHQPFHLHFRNCSNPIFISRELSLRLKYSLNTDTGEKARDSWDMQQLFLESQA